MSEAPIDLDTLLKLRLVVARAGEMDNAGWWNTRGLLGRLGAVALARGFPATHRFAQARAVFAVARARCREVFDPPSAVTLWELPAEVEDRFEDRWPQWAKEADRWEPFFEALEGVSGNDLSAHLDGLALTSAETRSRLKGLKRSAQGRAVEIPAPDGLDNEVLTFLAAGFALGESGHPAIPYARTTAC